MSTAPQTYPLETSELTDPINFIEGALTFRDETAMTSALGSVLGRRPEEHPTASTICSPKKRRTPCPTASAPLVTSITDFSTSLPLALEEPAILIRPRTTRRKGVRMDKEERRKRNREAAERTRRRRTEKLLRMEKRIQELSLQNQQLIQTLRLHQSLFPQLAGQSVETMVAPNPSLPMQTSVPNLVGASSGFTFQ